MRTRSLWVGVLLALATLAGCRTLPPPPPLAASAPWQERRPQLQALQHFRLKGRVALSAGTNGFNANLRWFQDGPRSQLALEGPLGVGACRSAPTATTWTSSTRMASTSRAPPRMQS